MAERLKDIFFTNSSINKFGDIIKQYYPEFDKEKFLNLIVNGEEMANKSFKVKR